MRCRMTVAAAVMSGNPLVSSVRCVLMNAASVMSGNPLGSSVRCVTKCCFCNVSNPPPPQHCLLEHHLQGKKTQARCMNDCCYCNVWKYPSIVSESTICQHCLLEHHLQEKNRVRCVKDCCFCNVRSSPSVFPGTPIAVGLFLPCLHQCLKQTTACTLNWNWNWRKTICTRKTREVCVNKGNVWLTAAASEMSRAAPALFARLPSAWGK